MTLRRKRERIGAGQPSRRRPAARAMPFACAARPARIGAPLGVVLVDRGGDAGHRRQVVGRGAGSLMLRRHRAAHDQPHDDFGAFHAAERRVVARCVIRVSASGSLLEEVEKLLVPLGVVEAGALAVDLVRQAAGGDDRDATDPPDSFRSRGAAPARACSSGAPTESETAARRPAAERSRPATPARAAASSTAAKSSRGRARVSWKNDMSNSSATRQAPMCCASAG